MPKLLSPLQSKVDAQLHIRALTVGDLPLCEAFGIAFMKEKAVPGVFSMEIFTKNWTTFLVSYPSIILGLWDGKKLVGGLGGMIAPDLNTSERIAQEFFWYVAPTYRHGTWPLRLLKKFRQWGEAQGADRLRMVHLLEQNESPAMVRLARVYEHLGMRPIEVGYDAPIEKGSATWHS